MNLGQTLLAVLALVLLSTITVTINKARINSTSQTIDLQAELEAINYGQSIVEIISNRANTETGYDNLKTLFHNWENSYVFSAGSGRTLYSKVEVDDTVAPVAGVNYKKVTVSIYADENKTGLLTEYIVGFNRWW